MQRFFARAPKAALLSVPLAGAIHLIIVLLVGPHPEPHRMLRQKAATVLQQRQPCVVALGDSRATYQICPKAVEAAMPESKLDLVNLSMENGDSSAALAVYRAFAHRFAPRPLVLLCVSFWSINDGHPFEGGSELLASLSFDDRWRLFGGKAACASLFTPERSWVDGCASVFASAPRDVVGERGFRRLDAAFDGGTAPARIEKEWLRIQRTWFADPVIDGVRWRQTVKDITTLHELGAQIVLIDAPFHPVLEQRLAGTPNGQLLREFQENLDALAATLGIPVLRYTSADLERDSAQAGVSLMTPTLDGDGSSSESREGPCPSAVALLFYDLLHLNEAGAVVLSRRIGEDLQALLAEGRVTLSEATGLQRSADAGSFP